MQPLSELRVGKRDTQRTRVQARGYRHAGTGTISIHRDTDATSHAALKQHCKQHCKDAQGHAQGHLNDLASECPRSIVWSVLRARERARHNALEAERAQDLRVQPAQRAFQVAEHGPPRAVVEAA